MFDSKLKPWLIEINQSPSFATDSAFDFSLKKKVMEDTFRLLNLSSDRKGDYIEAKEK
jgi:tubulin polyglutamylase TTLL6/13